MPSFIVSAAICCYFSFLFFSTFFLNIFKIKNSIEQNRMQCKEAIKQTVINNFVFFVYFMQNQSKKQQKKYNLNKNVYTVYP